jgi:hypothetical protein
MRPRRSTRRGRPPLDVGEIALAQGDQALPSRFGRAEGWCDDFGDEAVPGSLLPYFLKIIELAPPSHG